LNGGHVLAEPDLLLRRLLAAFGNVVGVIETDGKGLSGTRDRRLEFHRAEGHVGLASRGSLDRRAASRS
jgi:hypothetical protein